MPATSGSTARTAAPSSTTSTAPAARSRTGPPQVHDADHPELFAAADNGSTTAEFSSSIEGDMDLRGVLGMDPDVRNGYSTIRVNFEIDADADDETVAKIVQTKTPITAPITNAAEETMGTHYTAVVAGAGQAGLAMSRSLTDLSIDHIVLERGRIAERWQSERWDSLRLLAPNRVTRIPGYSHGGPIPTDT